MCQQRTRRRASFTQPLGLNHIAIDTPPHIHEASTRISEVVPGNRHDLGRKPAHHMNNRAVWLENTLFQQHETVLTTR